MSVKLLFNNIKSKANCPCCGNSEEECICVTLEELGATELELDFAIAGKYAGITYVSSSVTYSYNSKTWQTVTNNFSSSVLTSFNTKMAELGRVNATNLGTDYYGRFINSSTCVIYWNYTDYGTPNIARLNKLLAFTDEQFTQLETYGKCVPTCSICGEKHLEKDCPYVNTYVFNVTSANSYSSSYNRKITFPNQLRGDTSTWSKLTDWGDGTVDSSLNHTYSSDGVYTVKTKYCPSASGSSIEDNSNIKRFLTEVKSLNKNITSYNKMFHMCNLISVDIDSNFSVSNVTSMADMFRTCSKLTTVNMSNLNANNVTSISYMFYNCTSLTTLDMSGIDLINATASSSLGSAFAGCKALTDFVAPKNISQSISFSECTNLTHTSLMSIINNLATVSSKKTLTLGSTNKAKLTSDEIAIATAKNWTVS